MENKKLGVISSHPAVIAVWAALIAVAALLPAIPVIGTGATFTVADALVPLSGVLFGPLAGGIAAGVGGFLGQLLAPHTVIFGPFQFLIPVAVALCAGFAMQRKWIWPIVVTAVFGLAWYFFPLGRETWFVPLQYLTGVLASVVGLIWGGKWVSSKKRGEIFAGVFITALSGAVVGHSIGNLWALIMFALPYEIWFSVLPIAAPQRILFALGGAIIGTPLLIGLPKISIPVGPMIYEAEEE